MNNAKPTKEDILNDIYILYKQYNFINSKIYKEYGKYSLYAINKHFISFNNLLKEFNKLNVSINIENINNNKIDRQQLFNLANELFEKNNYLTEFEFYQHINIPINKFDNEFRSFTNFLKEANLYDKIINEFSKKQRDIRKDWHRNNSNKIFNFTKEEAISTANKMFNEIGEIKKDSYLKYSNYDKQTFLNMFNTFTEFLKEANLYEQMRIINNSKRGSKNNNFYNGNNKIKDFSKEDCFKIAEEILVSENNLNKELFLEKSNYNRKIFLSMFDNSFRNFINESGLKDKVKNLRKEFDSKTIRITKKELINNIFKYINDNNILDLKSNDLYTNTNITQNQIRLYWGSFTEMKKELNINVDKTLLPKKEEIINHMWYLYSINNNKLTSEIQRKDGKYEKKIIDKVFGSFNDMLIEIGLNINMSRNISPEELLEDLKLIVEKHGTINSVLIDKEGKYSRPTYLSKLGGSISTICKFLNIQYFNQRSSISASGLYTLFLISKILNENCEFEKSFEWSVNKKTNRKLRFDGYFKKNNLIVEYDGIQHFENVDFFYNNTNYVQENDKIKNELCRQNNVRIIRIKYDEPLNIEHLKKRIL